MKAALAYNQDGLKLYEDIYNNPKLDDFPLDRKVVRAGLAEAYTRVGVTQYRMGELTAALENYRKAYNLRRELADEMTVTTPGSSRTSATRRWPWPRRTSASAIATSPTTSTARLSTSARRWSKLKPNDLAALKELGDVYYMIGEFKTPLRRPGRRPPQPREQPGPTQGSGRPRAAQRPARSRPGHDVVSPGQPR